MAAAHSDRAICVDPRPRFPRTISRHVFVAEADVAETLELLAREGLFERSEVGFHDRARFKHTMICEAVYNTLLASDKQRLHSDVADLLTGTIGPLTRRRT